MKSADRRLHLLIGFPSVLGSRGMDLRGMDLWGIGLGKSRNESSEYTDEEAPTGRLNCNKNQEIGPGEEIRGDPGVIPGFQLVDCNPS